MVEPISLPYERDLRARTAIFVWNSHRKFARRFLAWRYLRFRQFHHHKAGPSPTEPLYLLLKDVSFTCVRLAVGSPPRFRGIGCHNGFFSLSDILPGDGSAAKCLQVTIKLIEIDPWVDHQLTLYVCIYLLQWTPRYYYSEPLDIITANPPILLHQTPRYCHSEPRYYYSEPPYGITANPQRLSQQTPRHNTANPQLT